MNWRRFVFLLLAVCSAPSAAPAQTAFDPATVAYVLCVTSETKKHALETPPLEKDLIIERAFGACADLEAGARKSFADNGLAADAIEERLSQTKKFIRITAPDDIDRQRVNRVPR